MKDTRFLALEAGLMSVLWGKKTLKMQHHIQSGCHVGHLHLLYTVYDLIVLLCFFYGIKLHVFTSVAKEFISIPILSYKIKEGKLYG